MKNILREAECKDDCDIKKIYNLPYADDTTLTAKNAKDLQVLVIKVKDYNEKMGLRLNIKMMIFSIGVRFLHNIFEVG